MGKFNGVLLCSDLDETLLNDDKVVSKENIDAIEYFKQNGGIFTFITGRTHRGIGVVLSQVEPNTIIGCLNGGSLYDHKLQKTVMEIELSKRYVEILDFLDKNYPNIGFEVITHDKSWICKDNHLVTRHINIENLPRLECDYHDVPGKLGKILLISEMEYIDEIIHAIAKLGYDDIFDFVRSTRHYYEILPKNSNKGNLLKEIAKRNNNDLQMLKYAGCGFAVANAVEDAKKAADRVTVSNNDSAIAKIIDDLDKGLIF